jgi:PAS domain S-box-containing protein
MRVDRDGVFLVWSPGLEEVFGYTEAEVLGRNLELLVPSKLRPLHRRGFARALATGRLRHQGKVVHSVGVHKDGHLVPFRAVDILEFGTNGIVETVGAVVADYGWGSVTHRLRLAEPSVERSIRSSAVDST